MKMDSKVNRFWKQAFDVLPKARENDVIDAFNMKINGGGISPTITTRPEGFKTAILIVVGEDEDG